MPITAADQIPARTGPPRRPLAAVSIQVANVTRGPRTHLGAIDPKGIEPIPFGLSPLWSRVHRFWCFAVGAPRGGRFAVLVACATIESTETKVRGELE